MSKSYKVAKKTMNMGPANLYGVNSHSCRREGGARPLRLLREGEPKEGLRHRVARLRKALSPLPHWQGGG